MWSPVELSHRALGASIQVGGRVVEYRATSLILADAEACIGIEFAASTPTLGVGCIAILRGMLTQGPQGLRLSQAQLSYCQAAGEAWERPAALQRLLFQGVGPRLRQAAAAKRAIRSYFAAEEFVEVDTPAVTAFPGTDPFIEPVAVGQERWLITSPESHMKQLLAAGMPKIYQICHCFRREERGPLHRTQFQMLEWYRSFATWTQVLADTEALLCSIAQAVRGEAALVHRGRRIPLTPPFERLSVRAAFARYAGIADASALAEQDEARFFELLVSAVEPALAQHPGPVVLHDYPLALGALARSTEHDPNVVERFEIYAAGVELCNGYGELTCAKAQAQRFEADVLRRKHCQQPTIPPDEPLLQALASGMPPAAGNALGLDRVLMLASGAQDLHELSAFAEDEGGGRA